MLANLAAEPKDSEHPGCYECSPGVAVAHALRLGLRLVDPDQRSQTKEGHLLPK